MDKNFSDLSHEQIRQLASSPAARELMQLLQQHHAGNMNAAIAGAQNGDQAALQRSLAALMADPQTRKLLRRVQEEHHG